MPSLCGFTWNQDIDNAIVNRAYAHGVPLDIAYTFIAAESAFYSYAAGDEIIGGNVIVGSDGRRGMVNGVFKFAPTSACGGIAWEGYEPYYGAGRYFASHGLNQLSSCGGQGQNMTWSQMVNPWTNCDVAFSHLAPAFRACWSPTIDQESFIRCVMRQSGHPGNVPDGNPVFEAAFDNIWPKWLCFYQSLLNHQPPPVPDPPPPPPIPTPPLPNPIPPLPPAPPLGVDSTAILLLTLGVGAAMAMALRKGDILKKIKIISPNAPVKILKK